MPPPTPPHVIALIEAAADSRATFLDLGRCGLRHIPPEIAWLGEHLEWVNFGDGYWSDLDKEYTESSNTGPKNHFAPDSEGWEVIGKCPRLRQLTLSDGVLLEGTLQKFAKELLTITSLDISNNQIGEAGATAIARGLPGLTSLSIGGNQIGEAGATAIARGLPGLTSLDISYNQIGEAGAAAIASGLPGLTSLSISSNQIGEAGAVAIAKGLSSLTTLDLNSNQIGDAGAVAIAKGLSNLTSINLSGNQIGDAGAEAIAEGLPNLTSLSIGSNQIGDAGAVAIAEGLSSLTSLDLSSNQIGDAGAMAIAGRLSILTSLNFSSNQIGDAGAVAIANGLSSLTSLDLWNNQIGDAGAVAIAKGLSSLTSLDVGNNQIGDTGAVAIASGLSILTLLNLGWNKIGELGTVAIAERLLGLTSLDLSSNQIGELGTVTIAERLSSLTTLNLRSNQIGDVGAVTIAERLLGLTSLDLSSNQIGDAGAVAIASGLSNLTTLYLWNNQIGDAGAAAIASGLSNLTSINLSGNQIGDAGAAAIASGLSSLTTLYLWNNQIGDAGAVAIASGLSSLTSLMINSNQIGNAGAVAIAERLSSLTSLNLSSNQIGDAGAVAIAERLSGLTSLDLSINQIGDTGAVAIAEGLSGLTSLDLRSNQIGEAGAVAIAEGMSGLTSLDLGWNKIGEAGTTAIAKRLSSLTSLNLSSNRIGEAGVAAITQHLYKLTSLDLDSNQIGDDEAATIAQYLTKLTSLSLDENQIGDEGVVAIVENLPNLNTLQIGNNRISDRGATAIAQHLHKLESLDINDNQISNAGFLRTLVERATRLDYLSTYNNRLAGIPREIADEVFALRHWYAALDADTTPLYQRECKVLLCGNSGVGKSCLLDRLQGKPFEPKKESTHGVRIESIILGPETTAWVWDFGGQEIYHSTHRLFLRGESVFLLVWDQDTEREALLENRLRAGDHFYNHRLAYWLHFAEAAGGERPVVIVQNKIDEPTHAKTPPELDGFSGKSRWTSLSAKTADEVTMEMLRRDLQQAALGLREYGMQVPRSWWAVREELLELVQTGGTRKLSKADFYARCERCGVPQSTSDSLLSLLNDSGVIMYDEKLFPEEIVVDQQWALDAIYAILDPRSPFYMQVEREGYFKRWEIFHFWGDEHSREDKELFLRYMQAADLCFAVNEGGKTEDWQQFVLPSLLRIDRQPLLYDFWAMHTGPTYYLRYRHPALDFYTIQRFITDLGRKVPLHNIWRNGLHYSQQKTHALVEANVPEASIFIRTTGPRAAEMMDGIRNKFHVIHGERPVSIEVSANGRDYVELEKLREQSLLPGQQYATTVTGGYTELEQLRWALRHDKEIDLDKLPDIPQRAADIIPARRGKRLFISYAEQNRAIVERLLNLLTPLERAGQLDLFWDRDLNQKQEWSQQIEQQLRQAEGVVVIASVDYFGRNKHFIYEHEIPIIRERFEAGAIAVFPIVVEAAAKDSFADSDLGVVTIIDKNACLETDPHPQGLTVLDLARRRIKEEFGLT